MLTISAHKGNANQNHIKIPPYHTVRITTIKNTNDNKYWRGCVEKEQSYTAGENVNYYNHCGK
jgi:hypothetical protein